jgi:8-oxo-dGTP pyrophosphatase MutT (NUDIX family)
MGAGILPTTIHNNKLYFLFGKENKYEDSAPGFSDFGGGTDNNETFLETALREAGEELTGFLGSKTEIKQLFKPGTYNIDYLAKNDTHQKYRMHIFYYPYNEYLPFYYNNNQKFLQTHLTPEIIKNSKIFEKEEIRWICIDDMKRMRPKFRSYFQNIIDIILKERLNIQKFIELKLNKKSKKPKNKTIKLK